MKKKIMYATLVLALVTGSSFIIPGFYGNFGKPAKQSPKSYFSQPPIPTLKLPKEFHVEIVADNLGVEYDRLYPSTRFAEDIGAE